EFAWPVNFGIVDPEAIEYRTHHQGISIKGEFGDPVVAVNDGKVIYSGNEIRGYGNMIVIQHDDDLVSIYANNQFNYVTEGDSIRRGQLIGDIGQLFNEDAAGLYFEIRHNGEPEDPFNYLRSNQSMDLLTAG
ncbi:MAG: lipoprotein NlpD, partial [Candidatus Azotimanducaceae bacterium]